MQKMPGILQNCKFQQVISFTTASSTVAATHSADVDCSGFGSVMFMAHLGATAKASTTSGDPFLTVLVGATTTAYTTATSLTTTGSTVANTIQIIDIPKIEKRFAVLTYSTTTTCHLAATAILYNPLTSPTSQTGLTLGAIAGVAGAVTT